VAGRHSSDKPRRVDKLSERQYLALVLAIVAGVLVLLAGLGYGIYLLSNLTILLASAVSGGLVLAVFVWSLVDRDEKRTWRLWLLPALVLESAVQFSSALGRQHHWPAAQYHIISLAQDGVSWAIVPICLAISLFLMIPPARRRWPWRRGGPGTPAASPPGQS
jgi:hypothetical protein